MYRAFRDVLKTPPCLVKNIGRCICWCYGRNSLSQTMVLRPVNSSMTRTGDKRTPLLRGLQACSKDVHVPRGEATRKGLQQQERELGKRTRIWKPKHTEHSKRATHRHAYAGACFFFFPFRLKFLPFEEDADRLGVLDIALILFLRAFEFCESRSIGWTRARKPLALLSSAQLSTIGTDSRELHYTGHWAQLPVFSSFSHGFP